MIPRRVRTAVLVAFVCHGLFILTARYRLSYDAYTHMLFANHYAEDWFSLWETRWYTGFTVVSYPPLTHQFVAAFVPILGFEKAFAFILWVVTSLYPLGIYAFSRVFTGRTSAAYASWASAILMPIYVSAHVFSQLPFLTSTLTALFAAASLNRYLREGGMHNFTLSVALITTSMAMHHATLMVHPFLIFAVFINGLFRPERRATLSKGKYAYKLILFSVVNILTIFLVIFPFWQWGANQVMQTPIDHLSRHNFLTSPLAPAIFFFPLYGPLLGIIPFLFRKWPRRFLGLIVAFTILFLLGLGGTTPMPRFLFGSAWEWLTYDRFAFWASLTLTPFFGILFIRLREKQRFISKPIPVTLRRNFLSSLIFSLFAITALGVWLTPILFPVQPKPIDMQPIVQFLKEDGNPRWRYLTFGFGDQFAYLNLLTDAATIDGSYHTARTLPELRESGVGQIDTAYWASQWMHGIEPILKASGSYGVRWGFVNPDIQQEIRSDLGKTHLESPFVPLLEEMGWMKRKTLDNGVLVYENPNVSPPEFVNPPDVSPIVSFSWGVFPMLAFVASTALGTLRLYPIQAEWVIRKIYSFVIGLLPITLCFWLFRIVGGFSHPRVYFTYDNALFFISDALVLLAVILWVTVKIAHPTKIQFTKYESFLFAIVLLASVSVIWSSDWRTSLYISLHFWLIFLFILSLRDWHETWQVAMFGLCGALSIQIISGFTGFALQSTAFLESLNMKWPGLLDPSMRGASVVQLADGLRILRAYGTLPHPNILGGLALIILLGPASLFLGGRKANYAALMLLVPGIVLIGLTFSRSAWLGLVAFMSILLMKSKHLDRKSLVLFVSAGMITVFLTLYPLRELVFTRISNAPVATEQLSTFGRSWLTEQASSMTRNHPLTGVGIGSFIIELADYAVDGAIIEPVHNLFLLAASELGIVGLLLVTGLFTTIAANIFKARTPKAILAGAALTGLGIVSLFDHYLWTLAPGRIMLGLALGLWAGQASHDA